MLTFRMSFLNPLWCVPSALKPKYLKAQLHYAQKSLISLFHDGCESYAILLIKAVPGESSSLPFIQTGSHAQFCCCYIKVGGLFVGCQLDYSRFQLWKLDQKAGWPDELGAGGVNKLDYQVYCSPKVGGFYMNWGRPSVMLGYLYNYMPKPEGWVYQNRPGYGKPQNCCIPGYMPNPWNGYYIQDLAVESIVLVPSQLRSIGPLAGQLGLNFLIPILISTHAMVELRVT
ncbi:MAG: hypothetical protein EZS28_048161 [Streblomastix strix]|uniref:Uncharacterized protein n=1 Tax=Streblomastix strix TaxID=222440 RepID=A0A5J4TFC0_9EUKA|nr:MAG: hypothetical protein EZS28_048161 [Streblomastix strix]